MRNFLIISVFFVASINGAKIGTCISPKHTLCNDLDVLISPKWYYNWGANSTFKDDGCNPLPKQEFVPMIWGYYGASSYPPYYIQENTTYILGFNEPNHAKQSNLTPQQAVTGWKVIQKTWGNTHKLVSPSASPCGNDCLTPVEWFDEFFKICNGECQVDYLATHMYSCNPENTMNYLKNLTDRYNLNIWLTEFACDYDNSHTVEEQQNYMKQIIPMLNNAEYVYRYSWFNSRDQDSNSLYFLDYNYTYVFIV